MTSYRCLTKFTTIEKWNIHGTSLGGLFVLEPWITPSLFYQFLNQNNPDKIAIDTYTFCKVLGQNEGKRQLNEHFKNWVNETHIKSLSNKKVSHLRIPVGDWMFQSYGPYIGCTDDAYNYLTYIMDLCLQYNIKVLLDLHGVKDSQNGLDNSGQSSNIEFIVSPKNGNSDSSLTFTHWPILSGNWIGKFNKNTNNYSSIHYDNIEFTKKVLYQIIDAYKEHKALYGIEPLNEPWIYTPIKELKDFYYSIYKYMHNNAPHLKFIYHDSFRSNIWDNFLINCSNVAMDWHIYQAWNIERYGDQFLLEADNYGNYIQNFKNKGIQLIVGEYSLATDNCAMWLNGFQDNIEGYPVCDCKYAPCPFPYINIKDMNRIQNIISPFGTGLSEPRMGTCPYEGLLIIDDDFNDFMRKLNLKKINSFEKGHGWFFWNFQTEFQEEIGWNFEQSYKKSYFKGSIIDPISFLNKTLPLWKYGILLFVFLGLMFGLFGIYKYIYNYHQQYKKNKQYQYVKIELPINEKQHINKKNIYDENYPYYQSL